MANKPLKSIKFPNLPDTYTIPQDASDVGAVPAPATIGTNGQVLALDSNLDTVWVNQSGGGGTTEIYWATYGTTTSAELETAYQAGKLICVEYSYGGSKFYYTLCRRTSATYHCFSASTQEKNVTFVKCENSTWSMDSVLIPAAYISTPAALGTASAGSSTSWAKGDHVHAMPSAADVGAVAVAQGVAHAGEFVVVGSDGNITTVTMATWSAGSY